MIRFTILSENKTDDPHRLAAGGAEAVMPVHCTGVDAIGMLKNDPGERCIAATSGGRYEY